MLPTIDTMPSKMHCFPITLNPDAHLATDLTDKDEPKRRKPRFDIFEPKLVFDRTLSDDPRLANANAERKDPSFVVDRSDKDDPRLTMPKTDWFAQT
jgi:hypothetical protein